MESDPKKIFWEKCKIPLNERKLSVVSKKTGIPEKSLRQFNRSGYLGDKHRDSLSKYLFNIDSWVESVGIEKPKEKTNLYVLSKPLTERRTGDVDRFWKILIDIQAEIVNLGKRLESMQTEIDHIKKTPTAGR